MVDRGLVSLAEMLELNASHFLAAIKELRRLNTVLEENQWDDSEKLQPETRHGLAQNVAALMEASQVVQGRIAWVSAKRLFDGLKDIEREFTVGRLRAALGEIESRFADEMQFVKFYVVAGEKLILMEGADRLLGQPAADLYPSVWFDCEEAALCLAFGRSTACVFHCMRMLEIAIRALHRRLGMAEIEKPSERNWGVMLREIKNAMDELHPPGKRLPHSEGAFLENIFTTLDAIKNPWRNATMHVDRIYTDQEANHILQCTATLIQRMAEGFDESGEDSPSADLIATPDGSRAV